MSVWVIAGGLWFVGLTVFLAGFGLGQSFANSRFGDELEDAATGQRPLRHGDRVYSVWRRR